MATEDGASAHPSVPVAKEGFVTAVVPALVPIGEGAELALMSERQRVRRSPVRRFIKSSPLGFIMAMVLLAAIFIAILGPFLGTGDRLPDGW
jgi:hypothetical protein